MHRKIKNIITSLMAVVILSTTVLVLLSHFLCGTCASHMEVLVENTISSQCCHLDLSSSENQKESSKECPCCSKKFKELTMDHKAEKVFNFEQLYSEFITLNFSVIDLFEFHQPIRIVCFPRSKIPLCGRQILTSQSVLII